MRVGIDVGGTNTKISLLDEGYNIRAFQEIPTKTERCYTEVVKDIAHTVLQLLEENGVKLDECVGIGVGIPGTIDVEKGVVLYSNNINWEDVPFAEELNKYIPLPVRTANDADCAALGEVLKGAAKGCQSAVFLTIGTGVGSGIVLNGKLVAGSEIGHMVLLEDGELCTCGRKGCFEAYASATALVRDAKCCMEEHSDSMMWKLCDNQIENVTPLTVFSAAEEGDMAAQKVKEAFLGHLATGVVNIVNIFRPEMILIGGGVSKQGSVLTDALNEAVERESFAGQKGKLPQVKIATLGNQAGMIGAASLV